MLDKKRFFSIAKIVIALNIVKIPNFASIEWMAIEQEGVNEYR